MSTTEEIVARYRLELTDLQGQVRKLEGEFAKVDAAAKKSADTSSASLGKLGDAAKKVGGAIAAAFAVDRIVRFAFESVAAFREAETNARKLQAAVGANGGLTADFERLVAQSAQLQKETIFSDDQVQQAQTLALQFGLNADAVERLLPLVADFASATGQDLTGALQSVLQGVNGSERALKLYGVNVDAAASKNDRLASITEQLTAKFAGQAAVLRQTDEGGARALANTFDDLQEQLGAKLSPLLGQLANQARGFLEALQPTDSELLADEIQQLEALRVRLNSANVTQEERVTIMKEQQRRYPELLGYLDAERASTAQINEALTKLNNSLVDKLVLAKEDERVQKQIEKTAAARARVVDLELKAAQLLAEAQKLGVNLGGERLTLEQKLARVLADRDLRRQSSGSIFDAETRLLQNVTDVTRGLAIANGDLRQATEAQTGAENRRAEVVRLLGLQLGKTTKDTKDAATGLESVLDGVKLELQTVAQLEALLARARAAKGPTADEDVKKIEDALKARRDAAEKDAAAAKKADDDRLAAQAKAQAEREAAQKKEYDRLAALAEQYYSEQRRQVVTNLNLTSDQVDAQLKQIQLDQLDQLEQAAQASGFFEAIAEVQVKRAEIIRATAESELAKAAQTWDEFLKTPLGVYLFGSASVDPEAIKKQDDETLGRKRELQIQIADQAAELYTQLLAGQRAAAEEQAAADAEIFDEQEARLRDSFDRKRISAREYEEQLGKLRGQRARGEEELAKKQREIQRQADIIQRARALFQIYTNTAAAVSAALITSPLLVPFIKALGLLQAATVLATPLPKYFYGVSKVPRGKNKPGIDTVPALLTEGERVVTVERNRKYWDVLEAISQDRLRQWQERHVLAPALRAARSSWQAEERARWAAVLPLLGATPAAAPSTAAPTTPELADLWRRGIKIRNLDELAALLRPPFRSPYQS